MRLRYVESPVVFGRDESLIGLTCQPLGTITDHRPWVIFLNAGIVHRTGPHRMTVHLARALAGAGIPSLRFDLSGIGDSALPASAAPQPIQDRVQCDIDDAMAFVRGLGPASGRSFVLSGLCSGADNALRAAKRCADVAGLVLLDLNVARTRGYYLRHYGRRLLQGEAWRNVFTGRSALFRTRHAPAAPTQTLDDESLLPPDEMREHLYTALARNVRILCVFTAGIETQYNYEQQFADLFPEPDIADRVRVLFFGKADHTFSDPTLQQQMCGQVVQWIAGADLPATQPPPTASAPQADAPPIAHAGGR